ncbi:MAG: mercury methylation ferredoxin HgcB [Acidaminobacteraceae bacterium]
MLKYIDKYISLELDDDKCIGCRLCFTVCPHRVFNMHKGKAFIKEKTKCIECGACMSNCPVGAIKVDAGVGCAVAILSSGNC